MSEMWFAQFVLISTSLWITRDYLRWKKREGEGRRRKRGKPWGNVYKASQCVTDAWPRESYIKTTFRSPFLKLASEHVACYSDMLSFILAQDKMWRRACVCGVMMMGGGLIGLLLAGAFEVPWKSVSKTMIFRGIKTAVSQAAHNVSIPTQRRAIQSSLPCSPWRPGCLILSDGSGKSTELLSVRAGLQPASPNQVKVSETENSSFKWIIRACVYGSFAPADASG